MTKGRWFCRGDLIPIALCLAAAIAVCVWCTCRAQGQELCVTTPTEERVYALTDHREETIVGNNGLKLTLVIEDGAAYVHQADCPDQVCVHTGRLTRSGDSAACLPAGVVLTVRGEKDAAAPDAVAR